MPIYKSDDKLLVSNYHHISILPFFSKTLGHLMYNRLLNYLNNNNILTDKQYGFRERHNTSMALLRMINDITQELDSNNFCIGLFLDLSKAFDTVNHLLLLKKSIIMESGELRINSLLITSVIENNMYQWITLYQI